MNAVLYNLTKVYLDGLGWEGPGKTFILINGSFSKNATCHAKKKNFWTRDLDDLCQARGMAG